MPSFQLVIRCADGEGVCLDPLEDIQCMFPDFEDCKAAARKLLDYVTLNPAMLAYAVSEGWDVVAIDVCQVGEGVPLWSLPVALVPALRVESVQ